jgi:two-component system nitrogen regulation response regulator NtrX
VIDEETGATTENIDRDAPFGDRVLLVIDGAALQVVPLPGAGTLTIGRSSKCNVVIDSGSVSRHHANLVIGPQIEIEDVGSSNGTTVDGVRLPAEKKTALTIGVPFLVGAVTLMVQTRAGSRREVASKSSQLAALEQSASRIAIGKLPVLIVGETGVGKERFAERIHEMSPRRPASFVRINCTAISEPLLEAELFGNDATSKPGMLEAADGGTAFLSDVDQLPQALQQKLLRVVEDAAVRRTGGAKPRAVDIRFISSTSKDLSAEVEANRFRRDLYFRLAGATFTLPPLRDRKDEVIPLAEQFIASAAGPLGRSFVLSDDAKQWLSSHDWPGNIRELRNAVERALILASGKTVTAADIDQLVPDVTVATAGDAGGGHTFETFKQEAEKNFLTQQLREHDWNVSETARALKMPRSNLYKKIERYRLSREPQ